MKIILWLGVTIAWGTALKGWSIRKLRTTVLDFSFSFLESGINFSPLSDFLSNSGFLAGRLCLFDCLLSTLTVFAQAAKQSLSGWSLSSHLAFKDAIRSSSSICASFYLYLLYGCLSSGALSFLIGHDTMTWGIDKSVLPVSFQIIVITIKNVVVIIFIVYLKSAWPYGRFFA